MALNRPYAWILAVVALITCIQATQLKNTEWSDVYISASNRLMAGEDIYPGPPPATQFAPDSAEAKALIGARGFVYPPFSSVLGIPFTFLPKPVSQFLLQALNFLALGAVLICGWRLAGGDKPLVIGKDFNPHEHLIALLAAACALRYAFNTTSHLQTDLLIAALILIGCMFFQRGRSITGAILWGLGAAFKATPLLFVFYLLWRRQFLAAFVMVLTFFAANFLPDLIHRSPDGRLWSARWFNQFVRPIADRKPGEWNASLLDNQSLVGLGGRLFLTTYIVTPKDIQLVERPNALAPATAKRVVYAIYALIALLAAIAMWPPVTPLRPSTHPPPGAYALECSIVFMVILLFSPMSSRAHFCTLILPALCIARGAIRQNSRAAWLALAAAFAFTWLSFNNPLARQWNRITLYYGFVTLATLSLLAGCLWLRWRARTPLIPAAVESKSSQIPQSAVENP